VNIKILVCQIIGPAAAGSAADPAYVIEYRLFCVPRLLHAPRGAVCGGGQLPPLPPSYAA